ncbi:MAG: exodeoxyribonuclease VII large subunit [Lachnospiraceae bacterium]|nr:exodeoxyribonuclease VII large subunit [Lachnospiraceae bacterium]
MNSIYSVGQVNNYIRQMFQQDFMLNRIYVRGEVSNCKYHNSGHIYFSLKDISGTIACVMFAGSRRGLAFPMKDGDKVVVGGSVSVYERDGRYQLYAKDIKLEGAGILYERFLALKTELEEMGMFAPEYKQPIPAFVRTVGIVTAPTGAAIQDIRNISYRRNPFIQLILYPAYVQGEGAKESIVEGIEALDALHPDVIIVGRGGGSIEDLWAFNEECVARAIFQCSTPIISAVGHETDTTIADFAADLRAPTPSAAAELAVPDIRSVLEQLEDYRRRLDYAMSNRLLLMRRRLDSYVTRWNYLSPENRILERRQQAAEYGEKLQKRMEWLLTDRRHRLNLYIEQLKGLSPLDKLQQGFSYVENNQHRAVTSVTQVKKGERLHIRVSDGTIEAQVLEEL